MTTKEIYNKLKEVRAFKQTMKDNYEDVLHAIQDIEDALIDMLPFEMGFDEAGR